MEVDDDVLGSAFGLGNVLAQVGVGVDSEALSAFLERAGERGGGSSSRELAAAIEQDDEDKFMDDVSEASLPDENPEDEEARRREQAAIKAEEERWARRAAAEIAGLKNEGDAEREARKKRQREERERNLVLSVWPDFKQGVPLKMSEVFYDTPAARSAFSAAALKKKRRLLTGLPHEEFAIAVAKDKTAPPETTFLLPSLPPLPSSDPRQPNYLTPIGSYFDPQWVKDGRELRREEMTRPPKPAVRFEEPAVNGSRRGSEEEVGRMLDLADWENDIILFSGDYTPANTHDPLQLRNDALESGDWQNEVIWDARRATADLVEDHEDEEASAEVAEDDSTLDDKPAPLPKLDPFNISNDHFYEHTRASRFRIRQTFGAIEVFHSTPAKVLQMPFYKTTLGKNEARSWHRPVLSFPSNVWLSFSKLKSNPSSSSRKNKTMTDPSERFKTTKDLSLTEKGPFVLLEFSEEYPPIMSGYGMGTTIVNYYRKKDDKDEHVPKLDLGQPSILNVGDAEPFLLGYVDAGKVTQVIHNNLLRAPIFQHKPETTDFLIIRQTINGHVQYHVREIKDIFTVGQTVPNESEVPGPHARKNTNTAKLRLMIVAWILIKKNKELAKQRVKLARLIKYFPDQTELQMRQRLKIKGNEFLEYDKDAGFHSGYWKLNQTYDFPTERKDVEALVTPEMASLYEAMQVGAQHLRDAGYTKTAEGKDEDEFGEDGTGLDIEQQLAVWATTLNYKRAEAQKAWLLVHGDGEPTGRGEGFSFLKTNMKNYFLRKGETEEGRRLEAEAKAGGGPVKISNAEQNRIYEEEKRKVWDLQWKALSNPTPPDLTAADDAGVAVTQTAAMGPRFGKPEPRHFSRAGSLAFDSPMEEARSPSAFSFDGESQVTGNDRGQQKVLRINRVVKGKQTVEIVRDPAVIQSYLRRVEERKLAQFTEELENLKPTGNMDEDELKIQALRAEVIRLKKNQQRRQQRKKYNGKGELPDVGEGEGKRKCGACGAYGHTKANRNCPKFAQSNMAPSPSTTPAAGPTPYGYGSMSLDGPLASPAGEAPPAAPMKIKLALGGNR
ncbi:Putative transcription initiation factor TFIID subunit [Vanrija pseudolonga]|uniref:Transcription initiation factor TFIID subunit n=1 Tax=Vanrija pseudolonga TaxID=143232 RepID=A0AAF0YBM6_9TREE|nr:Putative transcription initiation factor TFIID subunit [Vanrija pseudolonga]